MWILVMVVSLCVILLLRSSTPGIPPGPVSVPIFGHLHLFLTGPSPLVLFSNLARRYGALVSLKLGSVPVVLASTSEAAREILKTHDAVFASRPPTTIGRLLFYDHKDFALAPYGDHWRQLRKLCTLQLLTSSKIASFKDMRMEELKSLLNTIQSSSGSVVDVRKLLTTTTFDLVSRVILGKNMENNQEFIHLIKEIGELAGAFPVGVFLPWLKWMDIGNIESRFKVVSKAMDACIEKIVMEHEDNRLSRNGDVQDFVDLLLNLRDQGEQCLQDRDTMKALLIELFSAASETSSGTMEWALAELIKHPDSMEKLQREISEVVESTRLVNELDIPKLNYLQAVIKENFRLHPPAPLLAPHLSMEACEVMGFNIEKGTTVFVNVHEIGRDPSVWKSPLEFQPERFLDNEIDFRGHDFELLPFGSGRRMCPGVSFAVPMLYLVLANLVHAFDWKMPPGEEVDTASEKYGAAVSLAKKLEAVPSAKLRWVG